MREERTCILICIVLIITSTIPSTGAVIEKKSIEPSVYGNTLYVGGNGPGNYTKIQYAINDANPGDTVFVYDDSSPYFENITVNKSINLIGENKETTVIYGGTMDYVVYVSADFVNIRGFTIRNDNYYNGINLHTNYSTITDNIVSNTFHGIIFHYSSNNKILNNIIGLNRGHGVCLDESNNNTIVSNNITYNIWTGIRFYTSNNNNISENMISRNGDGMLLSSSKNNVIKENFINNNDRGIILAPFSLITPVYCTNNIIKGNTIISNNDEGIYFWHSYYNKITNNTITGNNKNGILLRNSSNNNINENQITLNNEHGIYIYQSSNNNTIFYNNFIENNKHAYDLEFNIWDDGSIGNYWDDYNGIDILPPYGIGDKPYNILPYASINNDSYPLMRQWPKSLSITITLKVFLNYRSLGL